jgi:hypothetical protein
MCGFFMGQAGKGVVKNLCKQSPQKSPVPEAANSPVKF